MFSNDSNYTYVILAALAIAVMTTFVVLMHAFYGLEFFG
jgi:hypothetical protein